MTTRLFPELKFGCSGKIVRFTVAVVNRSGQQKPKIQIWRLNDTQLSDTYFKSGLDIPIVNNSAVCLRHQRSDRIFRCTLNEAYQVSVQPGDILGLELPPEIDDDFDIYFTEPGPENYVVEGRLTSTANLSEASRITSHMPQINFTVILGTTHAYYNHLLYLLNLYTHTHTQWGGGGLNIHPTQYRRAFIIWPPVGGRGQQTNVSSSHATLFLSCKHTHSRF